MEWGEDQASEWPSGCLGPVSPGKAAHLWTPENRRVSWCLSSSNISSRASAKVTRTRALNQIAYFENTYFSKTLHFKLNHMSNGILASYFILEKEQFLSPNLQRNIFAKGKQLVEEERALGRPSSAIGSLGPAERQKPLKRVSRLLLLSLRNLNTFFRLILLPPCFYRDDTWS